MMSFGPPRRVVKDTKLAKDRTHEKQTHGESYREAHTGARFTAYTEKSLLVVKDYVFVEKNQHKDAQSYGEAFHGMPDGDNVPRYMWDTARSLARRDYIKKKKQKTWLPNGGGMKPYNVPEAPKPVATEGCVINVKAVKPKVDTWFRPKNKRSPTPDKPKLNRSKEGSPPRSPSRSPQRAATTTVSSSKRTNKESPGTSRVAGNNCGANENRSDSAVKSLTSYWNNHLKRHPFTMTMPQKAPKSEDTGRRDRGDDWRKITIDTQCVLQSRPKSVGSDGVVQEHTLVPSKVLADKKMSSVEDILTFVRRSSTTRTAVKLETLTQGQPSSEEEEPCLPMTAECEDEPTSVPTPPPSPKIQPNRKPSSCDHSKKSRHHHLHRQPLFVVKLHTRWMLAFKVLTLTFRPLVEAWKRRWHEDAKKDAAVIKSTTEKYELCQGSVTAGASCRPAFSKNPDISKKTVLRCKSKDASQASCKIGRIRKLARRGMSDTLKFLSRTRRRKSDTGEVSKTPESCFAVANQDGPRAKSCLSFLAGRNHVAERLPVVTEPITSSSSGTVVVYDEAKSSTAKSACLEVLPRGLRMSLYVEYHLLFSFLVVQSTLFLIVLFIKWLQEYTT